MSSSSKESGESRKTMKFSSLYSGEGDITTSLLVNIVLPCSLIDSSEINVGEDLKRQVSRSLITPHTLTSYQGFFSSKRETGFVELKTPESGNQWIRKWLIFEDGTLNFANHALAAQDEFTSFSMDKVISLRTDTGGIQPTITVKTIDTIFYLRMNTMEEWRDWLFCFQKSIALVLTKLMHHTKSPSSHNRSVSIIEDDDRIWKQALGDGHGYSDIITSRRRGGPVRAFTMEDVGLSPSIQAKKGGGFDSEPWGGVAGMRNIPLAAGTSPAIPINMGKFLQDEEENDSDYRERVASSYKEGAPSILAEMLRHQVVGELEDDEEELDDNFNDSQRNSVEDEDGYMMFDMDENIEEKEARAPSRNTFRSNSSSQHDGHSKSNRRSFNNGTSPTTSWSSLRSSSNGHELSAKGYLGWISGSCSKIGPREKNEDRFVAQSRLFPSPQQFEESKDSHIGGGEIDSCGYFAVYDGHNGFQAAEYLEKELHRRILSHAQFMQSTEQAIMESCIGIDRDFLEMCTRRRMYCGTTALGAFLIGSKLVAFNIGDSMAILCTAGVANEMNSSHKPGRQDEAERIANANGWITEERELFVGRLHRMDLKDPMAVDRAQNMNWVTIHRVCGEISVSRSIGDPDYKNIPVGERVADGFFLFPDGHSQIFSADLLIPDPECKVHEVKLEDEFLILASDGLWDVVSSSEAVKLTQKAFQEDKSPHAASEELCDLAIRLGSSDNVTVVIVQFIHS